MKVPKEGHKPDFKIRPGLNGDELAQFRHFLKTNSLKAARFVRQLILQAIGAEFGHKSGRNDHD